MISSCADLLRDDFRRQHAVHSTNPLLQVHGQDPAASVHISLPLLRHNGRFVQRLRREIALNSIHCNPAKPWQFVLGGGDEIVRIYDQRRGASDGAGLSSELSVSQPVSSQLCAICNSRPNLSGIQSSASHMLIVRSAVVCSWRCQLKPFI